MNRRNVESKAHNLFKQVRKRQRLAKLNAHRHYLRTRIYQLVEFLDENSEFPADWLGRFPELAQVLPQLPQIGSMWLIQEEIPRWFYHLRGPEARAQGLQPTHLREERDKFSIDLVILDHALWQFQQRGSVQSGYFLGSYGFALTWLANSPCETQEGPISLSQRALP